MPDRMREDINELQNSLSDTVFELASIKYALDEAAIVAITDIKGTITYVNSKFCEISKYSQNELIGNNHRIINSGYHPVEFFKEMYKTIGKGDIWKAQIRNRAKDGSFYWVDTTIVPLKNRDGKPIKYLAIRFDITAQKRTEERLKQTLNELEYTNKELEHFAYVASHDLREPLRMVTSYAQLIGRKYQGRLDENADVYINYLAEGTKRMTKLIDGLLQYSRSTASKCQNFAEVDLNKVLSEVLADLKIAIEESNSKVHYSSLPSVMGDPVQLRQLIQNLISNAIKYRDREPPVIDITSKENSDEFIISVKDNGIGISPENFDRVFVIFQRLHNEEEYPGTGIGLAVCKRIVERHGGRIWLESKPSKGSEFFFSIPKV